MHNWCLACANTIEKRKFYLYYQFISFLPLFKQLPRHGLFIFILSVIALLEVCHVSLVVPLISKVDSVCMTSVAICKKSEQINDFSLKYSYNPKLITKPQTLQLLKFLKIFNPLIPKMAQHFNSPYNVIPESSIIAMRIKETISNLRVPWFLNNLSSAF